MDAIYDWVSGVSGLTTIWSRQKGPRPSTPHIVMTLAGEDEYGSDWMTAELLDEEDAEPGADVQFTMVGPRVVTLKLECFTVDQDWNEVRPERVLSRVLAGRRLPSKAVALRAGGVGFGTIGKILAVSVERAQIFEPRAEVEITLHSVSQVSELGTYIEKVEVTPTVTESESEIDLPTITIELPEDP